MTIHPTEPAARRSRQRIQAPARALSVWLAFSLPGALLAFEASAAMYKCTDRQGNTEYTNERCSNGAGATPFAPPPLTVIDSARLTGGKAAAAPKDSRPGWLPKAPDPTGDCKAAGGTMDRELRACLIP